MTSQTPARLGFTFSNLRRLWLAPGMSWPPTRLPCSGDRDTRRLQPQVRAESSGKQSTLERLHPTAWDDRCFTAAPRRVLLAKPLYCARNKTKKLPSPPTPFRFAQAGGNPTPMILKALPWRHALPSPRAISRCHCPPLAVRAAFCRAKGSARFGGEAARYRIILADRAPVGAASWIPVPAAPVSGASKSWLGFFFTLPTSTSVSSANVNQPSATSPRARAGPAPCCLVACLSAFSLPAFPEPLLLFSPARCCSVHAHQ